MLKSNNIIILGRVLDSTEKMHQNTEVYDVNGICPTQKATQYKKPIKVLVKEKR